MIKITFCKKYKYASSQKNISSCIIRTSVLLNVNVTYIVEMNTILEFVGKYFKESMCGIEWINKQGDKK